MLLNYLRWFTKLLIIKYAEHLLIPDDCKEYQKSFRNNRLSIEFQLSIIRIVTDGKEYVRKIVVY